MMTDWSPLTAKYFVHAEAAPRNGKKNNRWWVSKRKPQRPPAPLSECRDSISSMPRSRRSKACSRGKVREALKRRSRCFQS